MSVSKKQYRPCAIPCAIRALYAEHFLPCQRLRHVVEPTPRLFAANVRPNGRIRSPTARRYGSGPQLPLSRGHRSRRPASAWHPICTAAAEGGKMNIRPVFRFAGAALLALAPRIAEADAYGPQFQVNTVTRPNLGTLDNLDAVFAASTGANGDSVVLWQDGPVGAVTNYIQRYDASGRRLQNQEWSVGTGARGVAVSGSGSFAIVRNQSDGAGSGVFVTIYNRAGSVIAPQVRVNDTLTGEQRAETIAMNASGTFVVGWSSVTTGGNPAY